MTDWDRVFDLADALDTKRAAVEDFHRTTCEEFLQGLVDDGEIPADLLPRALETMLTALQPMIDKDFVQLVGPAALN